MTNQVLHNDEYIKIELDADNNTLTMLSVKTQNSITILTIDDELAVGFDDITDLMEVAIANGTLHKCALYADTFSDLVDCIQRDILGRCEQYAHLLKKNSTDQWGFTIDADADWLNWVDCLAR